MVHGLKAGDVNQESTLSNSAQSGRPKRGDGDANGVSLDLSSRTGSINI